MLRRLLVVTLLGLAGTAMAAGGYKFSQIAPPDGMALSVISVNAAGAMVGSYNKGFDTRHGYLRNAEGEVTSFDEPEARGGTAARRPAAPLRSA